MRRLLLAITPILLLLTLLAACTHPESTAAPDPQAQLSELEYRAIATAADLWREEKLPYRDSCPLATLGIERTTDAKTFTQRCWVGPTGSCENQPPECEAAASCLARTGRGEQHAIVLAPNQPVTPDGEPVLHETLHLLAWCAGDGSYDSGHRDPRLWEAFGPGSLEQRGDKLMLEGSGAAAGPLIEG